MDATFHLDPESSAESVELVFESRGGGTRNTEYKDGLKVLLERLRAIGGATIEDAVIDTEATRDSLSESERRIHPRGRSYPISLDAESDVAKLRIALMSAQTGVGRKPGAKGGGNPNKRMRLTLTFPPTTFSSLGAIEDALALGQPPTFLARICWNSAHWVRPTGESRMLETGTYVTEYGFGHEEWLFNLGWVLDNGFHYAYLQPLRSAWERHRGRVIHIRLFTIAPSGERLYVGELRSCEVLTEEQAEVAAREYEKRGWIDEMREQVEAVEGRPKGLLGDPISRFNLRFRPSDATYFVPHQQATSSLLKDAYLRYRLYNWTDELAADFEDSSSARLVPIGPTGVTGKNTGTVHRPGTAPSSYDPVHNILQQELYKILKKAHGASAVTMEEDHVDLKVRLPGKTVFIELKTLPSARLAVRAALGQLLEYSYFRQHSSQNDSAELIVVAPAFADEDEQAYVRLLRTTFNIPISYRTFNREMRAFDLK
ncbi:hypothetical protein [Myxococcus qinghaiensis]|nr:hypothetical protein [Myxococcus qinghaiensis]MCP3163144.1 hypothetical protein [Myxococcus qinghaiensis]